MPGWMENFIKGQETWPQERFRWWATGKYSCICRECHGRYWGDRRSGHCYPCAKKLADQEVADNVGAGI